MARARSVELWNRQTPPWLVSIDSSFCPCTRLLNELEAGWCTSYQVRRCGVVMPRFRVSGNTELVVGDPLLHVG